MLREKKFRAWNFIVHRMQYFTLPEIEQQKGSIQWHILDIMDSTGVLDSTDKLIYEKDIILYPDTESEYVHNGVGQEKVAETKINSFYPVEFRDGSYGIEVTSKWGEVLRKGWHTLTEILDSVESITVIGNAYEDAEIIKNINQ